MHLNKKFICYLGALALMALSDSLTLYAQAAGGGTGAATTSGASTGSAAGGNNATGTSSSSATSPSTLGGSVSGSSSQPGVPGSTAGDTAVNPNNSPMATPAGAIAPKQQSPANEAVRQRGAQGSANQ